MRPKEFKKFVTSKKEFSDNYIAHIMSELAAKYMKWKWENRNDRTARNPYKYLTYARTMAIVRRHRPEVFRVISKM